VRLYLIHRRIWKCTSLPPRCFADGPCDLWIREAENAVRATMKCDQRDVEGLRSRFAEIDP